MEIKPHLFGFFRNNVSCRVFPIESHQAAMRLKSKVSTNFSVASRKSRRELTRDKMAVTVPFFADSAMFLRKTITLPSSMPF
jgi:hypothetical protein